MYFEQFIELMTKLSLDQKLVLHCSTIESAKKLMENLNCFNNNSKYRIMNIDSFLNDLRYYEYKDSTCYFLTRKSVLDFEITYQNENYANDHGYTAYDYKYCEYVKYESNNTTEKVQDDTEENQNDKNLEIVTKQYNDILVNLKQLSDKLDNFQITL